MRNHLLTVDTVTKDFENVRAVDRLSFAIARGEIFALLGPNGAGKTTTVRMLLGILHPDSGAIRYAIRGGEPAPPHPADLGYLPEERGLYREVPVEKVLVYMAALRGMPRTTAAQAASLWLRKAGLADRAKHKLDTLSKGNQQKVQFISAILHRPAFVILDEPFSGLDPINQDAFLDIIRALRDEGATVLLCAHQMNLVERLADRVLLLNRGREVLHGTIAGIRDQSGAHRRIIITTDGSPDVSFLKESRAVLETERRANGEVSLLLKKGERMNEVLAALASRVGITAIRTEEVGLHEIFVEAVRRHEDRPPGEVAS